MTKATRPRRRWNEFHDEAGGVAALWRSNDSCMLQKKAACRNATRLGLEVHQSGQRRDAAAADIRLNLCRGERCAIRTLLGGKGVLIRVRATRRLSHGAPLAARAGQRHGRVKGLRVLRECPFVVLGGGLAHDSAAEKSSRQPACFVCSDDAGRNRKRDFYDIERRLSESA